MNINQIKKKIIELKNKKVKIKVNLGRNKYSYMIGYIDKIYSNIFTVNVDNKILCFSYSDVVTKSVIIGKVD